MEDLRNGKLAPKIPKKRIQPLRGKYYFVEDGATPHRRHIVEQLRRQGASVVFSGIDEPISRSLKNIYGATPLTSLPPCPQNVYILDHLSTLFSHPFQLPE